MQSPLIAVSSTAPVNQMAYAYRDREMEITYSVSVWMALLDHGVKPTSTSANILCVKIMELVLIELLHMSVIALQALLVSTSCTTVD